MLNRQQLIHLNQIGIANTRRWDHHILFIRYIVSTCVVYPFITSKVCVLSRNQVGAYSSCSDCHCGWCSIRIEIWLNRIPLFFVWATLLPTHVHRVHMCIFICNSIYDDYTKIPSLYYCTERCVFCVSWRYYYYSNATQCMFVIAERNLFKIKWCSILCAIDYMCVYVAIIVFRYGSFFGTRKTHIAK